ncbi:ATP-binding protein [Providencia stuartii]|uniref:ATP-binding protein n=2 Tax=Providencia TaxID=586 RepID=A0A1S1HKC1_PROST|nr:MULTISPECIES: ATP-binding protein [Providencia]MDV5225823.1 ATP-binding protein [Providencia rettgeri]ELR5040594.1 ATP-binding protein [Providencia stuartii]ELR5081564.1 ATP-binding protein [Providencia stuartii]ELR5111855.1 ATP-binding protein [Providencia stuartii]ELR5298882.1 ATP-binding protein [Providencia stuartii]
MDQFALNFIVTTKLRNYLNQRHYKNDMFEVAASAAELYLMNRAAARYLEKRHRFTWEALVKNGNKPRDLIIDILTSSCPVDKEQAMKILSCCSHSLVNMMGDNKLFANVVNAKHHKTLNWLYVD